jgi:hypothetical protein
MPSYQVLSNESSAVDPGIATGIDMFAIKPCFDGFKEDNLEGIRGMQSCELGAGGAKKGIAPYLGCWMTAMKKVSLGVIFKAYRAAGIAAVPNRFDFLGGEDAVEELERMDQAIGVATGSRAQSWKVYESKGRWRPFVYFATLLEEFVLGCSSTYVVMIVAGDCMHYATIRP